MCGGTSIDKRQIIKYVGKVVSPRAAQRAGDGCYGSVKPEESGNDPADQIAGTAASKVAVDGDTARAVYTWTKRAARVQGWNPCGRGSRSAGARPDRHSQGQGSGGCGDQQQLQAGPKVATQTRTGSGHAPEVFRVLCSDLQRRCRGWAEGYLTGVHVCPRTTHGAVGSDKGQARPS